LRKKGKSLKGFFKGSSDKASSRRLDASLSKSAAPKAAPKPAEPPAVITTTETREQDDAFFGIEIDREGPEGTRTSSSETEAEASKSEKTKEGDEIVKMDTTFTNISSVSETASKTSEASLVDPAQSAGLNTEEKIISNTVQMILLLMDPSSRRFELLELEFDSVKAIVQDLLSQIPSSATEESVRDQKYDGICTIGGEEMTCTGKLKDFVEQNEGINSVVLAMPEGLSAMECAKMAKPILADNNVAAMVDPSGKMQPLIMNADATEMKPETAEDTAELTTEGASTDEVTTDVTPDLSAATSDVTDVYSRLRESVAPVQAQMFHMIQSLKEGAVPVQARMLNKLQSLKEGVAPMQEQMLNKMQSLSEGVAPMQEKMRNKIKSLSEGVAPVRVQILNTMQTLKEGAVPVPLLIALGMSMFFIPALAFVLYRRHSIISAPFSKGDIITPGVTRSHCGLFEKVPFVKLCEPKSVNFDGNGVLSLYHGDEMQWQMKGGRCGGSAELKCIVEITEDGSVMIAGKKARMEGNIGEGISPWPFSEGVSVEKKRKLEINLNEML
jgi:hypothetical protein